MNELEKAEDRLKHFKAPFSGDCNAMARAKVMARTIHSAEASGVPLKRNFRWLYAAAAALALMLLLPFAIDHVGNVTLTAEENPSTHTLPDGSKVMLAVGSSIEFNSILWYLKRTTELDGEAFFNVTSGDHFTVETTHGNVVVLGTEFSVWANNDALVVQCKEGRVDVEGEILEADDYLIRNSAITAQGKWTNSDPFISKKSDSLLFENTPIEIIVKALQEKFGKHIDYTSNGVYRFSGSLDSKDLESSLEILTKPFGLKVSSNKGGVVIFEP